MEFLKELLSSIIVSNLSFSKFLFSTILTAICILIVFIFSSTFFENFVNSLIFKQRPSNSEIPLAVQQPLMFDTANSTWVRHALHQTTASYCPIFDCIRYSQGDEPWGTVLDAGTGIHSLEWILELLTTSWVAVTGDPKREEEIKNLFSSKLRPQDKLLCGNWKDEQFLGSQVFDVVLADYLLGSIEGFAPYFQEKLFYRLRKHVGKHLYVTAAEPLPDKTEDVHGKLNENNLLLNCEKQIFASDSTLISSI